MTKDELIEYAQDRFGSEPEYLWANSPNTFIFRHQSNRKWFAVVMEVQRAKLGLSGEGDVFILDMKCGPLLSGSYLGKPGVLPAWHMNKNHWIGALLDGTAADDIIWELLEISHDLTKWKPMERTIIKDPIFLAKVRGGNARRFIRGA